MSSEMTVYDVQADMVVTRPPDQVLEEAKKAASALADVVSKKKKPVIMNGEQYLEFEDWQTVGRFYGVTTKVISTTFIDYGTVQGFEARAVALRADGMEISAAESMCLNDEKNWKDKPLFQLRSMAQTRACAKSLRNVLAWVVVLAGYRPTPAEEMQGVVQQKPNIQPPQTKALAETPEGESLSIKAVIEKTSKKEGKTGNKDWILYGILAGGIWYNAFDKKLFEAAVNKTGKEVELVYQTGKKGNNLLEIRFEGCTASPHTCDLSTWTEGKAACADGTACMFGLETV